MKKEDFDGIEPGDIVEFETDFGYWLNRFSKVSNDLYGLVDFVSSFRALTGKLAPWSSPHVPDDAIYCSVTITNGTTFYFKDFEYDTIQLHQNQPDCYVVTKRPSWRLKNDLC